MNENNERNNGRGMRNGGAYSICFFFCFVLFTLVL